MFHKILDHATMLALEGGSTLVFGHELNYRCNYTGNETMTKVCKEGQLLFTQEGVSVSIRGLHTPVRWGKTFNNKVSGLWRMF